MKKRMKKVATLCLAGVTAMSTVGVTGSAVFAKLETISLTKCLLTNKENFD